MKRRSVLLAGLSAAFAAQADVMERPWPTGRATPALALPTLDGPPWRLADQRGKVVLLNFWASWCPPCRDELPSLELLASLYEKQGLVVVTVNQKEGDATLKRFLDQMPLSLPILRDADGAASKAYGVRMFPSSVLIGRDGRAVKTVVGGMDWNEAQGRALIAPLLNQTSQDKQ